MKKTLSVALLCAAASLCVVPVVQAQPGPHAVWTRVAGDDTSVDTSTSTVTTNGTAPSQNNSKSDSTVHKCVKWVQKWIEKKENGKTVRVPAAVCAVRG